MSGALAAVIAAAFTAGGGGGGGLGYTLGASTFKNASGVTALTTDAVTTAATGSHFYIAVVYGSGSGVTSVADNKGNSANYVEVGTEQAAGAKIRWWYCPNGAGGAGHTATVNFGSAEDPTVIFWEWGGLLASGSLDQAAQITDNGGTPYTISTGGSTAQADEVVFALMGSASGDNPATKAEGSGFTIIQQSTNGSLYWTGVVAYKTVTATGVQSASFTDGATAGNVLKISTFRKA